MKDLVLFSLAGFIASLVDGALGMGFGPTCSSILLATGFAPTAITASVNIAKVVTGIIAGISHWKFKNINRKLVFELGIPGCIGALIGASLISLIDVKTLRPILSALLVLIGVRILLRFARPVGEKTEDDPILDPAHIQVNRIRGVRIAGFLGGITNGMIGAWGPVVTPFLLHHNIRPRFAVGSVNTAEIAVALATAVFLLFSLESGSLNPGIIIAMLIGGAIAAPIAAWLIRFVPARPLGVAVAGLLLLTNAKEVASWAGIKEGAGLGLIYSILSVAILIAFFALPFTRLEFFQTMHKKRRQRKPSAPDYDI